MFGGGGVWKERKVHVQLEKPFILTSGATEMMDIFKRGYFVSFYS